MPGVVDGDLERDEPATSATPAPVVKIEDESD